MAKPPRSSNTTAAAWGWTCLALACFAANSLLCRLALRGGGRASITPELFTLVRLVSGALLLLGLFGWPTANARGSRSPRASRLVWRAWLAALLLAVYMVGFSFAYVALPAGIGALLLFGTVQLTMLGGSLVISALGRQPFPSWRTGAGMAIALAGLAVLTLQGRLPGSLPALPSLPLVLMIAAGAAWGLYSLVGNWSNGTLTPAQATTANFARASLLLPLLLAFASSGLSLSSTFATAYSLAGKELSGLGYALLSGMVTSALGYIVWYRALPLLRPMQAALAQLSVPPLAVLGGVVLLREPLSSSSILGGALILTGVALSLLRR